VSNCIYAEAIKAVGTGFDSSKKRPEAGLCGGSAGRAEDRNERLWLQDKAQVDTGQSMCEEMNHHCPNCCVLAHPYDVFASMATDGISRAKSAPTLTSVPGDEFPGSARRLSDTIVRSHPLRQRRKIVVA
jgi:hypothetical protein